MTSQSEISVTDSPGFDIPHTVVYDSLEAFGILGQSVTPEDADPPQGYPSWEDLTFGEIMTCQKKNGTSLARLWMQWEEAGYAEPGKDRLTSIYVSVGKQATVEERKPQLNEEIQHLILIGSQTPLTR